MRSGPRRLICGSTASTTRSRCCNDESPRCMRAVILAAGRGSRMGPLTDATPKCLLPLGGRPLLEWQVAALRGAGIDTVGIVRGYNAHLFDGRALTTFENPRWAETNMVASLACAS